MLNDAAKFAYDGWRTADAEARRLEAQLAEAWIAYDAGNGPVPSEELMRSVSKARANANVALSEAMLSMRALHSGVKHPSPGC